MKQYKVIKIYYEYKLAPVENIMNDMAKEGWEVVCMTPDPTSSTKMILTLCREEAGNSDTVAADKN